MAEKSEDLQNSIPAQCTCNVSKTQFNPEWQKRWGCTKFHCRTLSWSRCTYRTYHFTWREVAVTWSGPRLEIDRATLPLDPGLKININLATLNFRVAALRSAGRTRRVRRCRRKRPAVIARERSRRQRAGEMERVICSQGSLDQYPYCILGLCLH